MHEKSTYMSGGSRYGVDVLGLFVAAIALLHSPATQAQQYTITELRSLDPSSDFPTLVYDVNNDGISVGTSAGWAVEWGAGGDPKEITLGVAKSINSNWDVIGMRAIPGRLPTGGFLLSQGNLQFLDDGTTVTGINDSGDICGYWELLGREGFILSQGQFIDLEFKALVGGICPQGDVVGGSLTQTPEGAFVYNRQTGMATSLGFLPGGAPGAAESINGDGDAVGFSYIFGPIRTRAVLYHAGVITNLGILCPQGSCNNFASSKAHKINDNGQVVGEANGAFLYDSQTGTMIDLNTVIPQLYPHWTLISATSINNLGQIVGNGVVANDTLDPPHQAAFMLTPT